MTGQTWLMIGVTAVVGFALGGFVLTRTQWFKVRKYAIDIKKVYDKYKIQEKAEAVQALGQNPNPVLAKKPLREIVSTYQGLIGELEKVKVPAKAKELHEESLTMHKESMSLYQMAMVGGFRQKSMMDKQRKLQSLEKSIQEKTEKLYGPMKKPKEKK